MRALLLAFALPAVLGGLASDADDRGAQAPFTSHPTHDHRPTMQERYDGQAVQRFNLQGMSRDRRNVLVEVLKVSGAGGFLSLLFSVVRWLGISSVNVIAVLESSVIAES